MPGWIFLVAYVCSGFAGLVYEVAWTRLLTLYLGHSTAAVSTVVAAFMGGLAAGAAIGGRVAERFTRRGALYGYAALEAIVVLAALVLPFVLGLFGPPLAWAYRDGAPGWFFPFARVVVCFVVLLVPTLALGATFPFGVRWFVSGAAAPGSAAGALYAANTIGAAIGAVSSAFVLIPSLGLTGATLIAVAAGAAAMAMALVLARASGADGEGQPVPAQATVPNRRAKRERRVPTSQKPPETIAEPRWLGPAILALSGASTFLLEIAWTRLFASVIGPSTYAFAAVLTGVIGGLAIGSTCGAALAARVRRPALSLAIALGAAAAAATWASSLAGRDIPLWVIQQFVTSVEPFGQRLLRQAAAVAGVVAPTAFCLGVAYPLALAVVARGADALAQRLGSAYAVNTLASVAGSLSAGFIAIPMFGLHRTMQTGIGLLLIAAAIAALTGRLSTRARIAGLVPAVVAAGLMLVAPAWDRELLASGGYKYAARIPKDVDLPAALKAGSLLYYREGPSGIVSVKEVTGERSLAIDGKVDASSAGDMLTQKLLAHLPLLLHADPDAVCIIGLGSGVTLAAALVHPIEAVDVVEISPEVVEASSFFAAENRGALKDARARLILGDGRSHLAWSSKQYDVVISEPSNPWMAGVAALFTREFFEAVRERLAPDGIICQWAHTYDISEADLRSIVETFRSVFPDGTMWLVGNGDLLLIGSREPIEARLTNLDSGWKRAGIADDLRSVSVTGPFTLWSLFAGGPAELKSFGAGASIQSDDRMALEFSGPSAINSPATGRNVDAIRALLEHASRPEAFEASVAAAGAAEWADRAEMMFKAGAYDVAYQDYVKAISKNPEHAAALTGFTRAAAAARKDADAVAFLKATAAANPRLPGPRIELSKLLAAGGSLEDALGAAREAVAIQPLHPEALDQLASLFADAGDAAALEPAAAQLQQQFPHRATAAYYVAALQFLRGQLADALKSVELSIDRDATRASSHNLRGAVLASLGDNQRARDSFQQALRLDPRDVNAYNNLGLLELSSGNVDVASNLFAEALTLDPASPAAREGLARAH